MKTHGQKLLIIATMLGVVAAACGDDNTTPPPPPPPPAGGGAATVRTVGTAFEPADITVAAGTTVTWVVTDGVAHTVTSGTGSSDATAGQLFDQQLVGNRSVQFTFNNPGTFPYFCRPHELMNMRGTVTVTGATVGARSPGKSGSPKKTGSRG